MSAVRKESAHTVKTLNGQFSTRTYMAILLPQWFYENFLPRVKTLRIAKCFAWYDYGISDRCPAVPLDHPVPALHCRPSLTNFLGQISVV